MSSETNRQGFNLLACFLGFSLFWAWRWMYYYTDILMVWDAARLPEMSLAKNLDFLFQFLTLAIIVLAVMRNWERAISDKTLFVLSIVPGLVSTPMITLSGLISGPGWIVVAAVGWVLRGVAGSAMTCLWAKIFCSVSERNACLYISLSLVLGTAIMLVLSCLPFASVLGITALLPAISVMVFILARTNLAYRPQKYQEAHIAESERLFPQGMMHLIAAVAIVSAVYGALVVLMAVNQSGSSFASGRISVFAPGITGAVIAAVVYRSPKLSSIETLNGFSLPLLMVGLLVYLVVGGRYMPASSFVMVASFTLFDTVSWFMIIDGAYRHGYPVLGAFLMARAGNVLGMLLGRSLLSGVFGGAITNPNAAVAFSIVAVGILAFVGALLLYRDTSIADSRLSDEIPKSDIDMIEASLAYGLFAQAIKGVAEKYSLSPREAEVLELLARGKTSKQIQEALVISSHTVNAHTYHIYQKTGVHKKSELQDLVETFFDEK